MGLIEVIAGRRKRAARAPDRRRPLGLVLAAVISLMLAAPGPELAGARLPGPTAFSLGFTDDAMFQNTGESWRATWLGRARQIGSNAVRLNAYWRDIGPARLTRGFRPSDPGDPRYRWSALDAGVRSATAYGQSVMVTVSVAPPWAESSPPRSALPGTWRPKPEALGAFAHALAKRYSGHFPDPLNPGANLPNVSYFQAWNEPNLLNYLMPQWTKTRNGSYLPASPAIYRRLLNAFYASVKSVQPGAHVLAAATAPYGGPPRVDRMAPVVFLRELLCLHGNALRPEACPNPAHFDIFDHHPYSPAPFLHARLPDNVSVPDIGKLSRILRAAVRTGRVRPARPKPIWVTELDWTAIPATSPRLARQARYVSQSFYELWSQGVSRILWYLIRDPPPPVGFGTGAGLYYLDGTAKPSADAFHFPFVAIPQRHGGLRIWGRAPVAGVVTLARQNGQRWTPLIRLTTTPSGIFYAQRRLGAHLVLRAQIGQFTSVGWSTSG